MRSFPIRPDIQTATSSSYDADRFLSLGVDGDSADVALQPVESMPPLGLFARPIDPATDGTGNPLPGQSCSLLRLVGDNDDQAIALTDPRVVGLLPLLAKGAVCLYEPTNVDADGKTKVADLARVSLNDDGSHRIVIHAPASTTPTKIIIEIAGGPTITVDGTAVPPNVKIESGGTALIVDSTGVQAGAAGGTALALAAPAFLAWLGTVGAATSAGPPPAFAALRAKAT